MKFSGHDQVSRDSKNSVRNTCRYERTVSTLYAANTIQMKLSGKCNEILDKSMSSPLHLCSHSAMTLWKYLQERGPLFHDYIQGT
jgi:hypothetical protein